MSTVTLVDGRVVNSDNREYLMECFARHLLSRPIEFRQQYLAELEGKGEQGGADAVREALMTVHKARVSASIHKPR
jgi:hypothetical protein